MFARWDSNSLFIVAAAIGTVSLNVTRAQVNKNKTKKYIYTHTQTHTTLHYTTPNKVQQFVAPFHPKVFFFLITARHKLNFI